VRLVDEAGSSREERLADLLDSLPPQDNAPGALEALLMANEALRVHPWPTPYDRTSHRLISGDARSLEWLPDASVHLVVTSPPYWTLKKYNDGPNQLGDIGEYEAFLDELDRVWAHCYRALVPGGRVCCVVGDVCIARRNGGRHRVMPLHSDLQVRARKVGFDNLTPILWHKIANGVTEAAGNGGGYYGKPYQPGAVLKNDVEYVLFFRKAGGYRSAPPLVKALSMLNRDEVSRWMRSIWSDVPGASTARHPAPYPEEIASRLIRMFSFAGDTVLDPFAGTGTTTVAAIRTGRNSVSVEVDPEYLELARRRAEGEASQTRLFGAIRASVTG
jgi:modification methylase